MVTTRLSVLLIGAMLLGALGSERGAAEPSARITTFAASSLSDVLPKIDSRPRYSFAASNTLAQQIRQGAPADVFASADLATPQGLHASGLCGRPSVFATNGLVLAVPRSNPGKVRSALDLRRPGVKVVIAKAGTPIGNYTRTLLRKLGVMRAVLANVVSQEPDVRSVLAKVALGEADAGIVYRTDAGTVKRQVNAIPVPARAQPRVRYGICVVRASDDSAPAAAFVAKVLGKVGRARLSAAGFGLP